MQEFTTSSTIIFGMLMSATMFFSMLNMFRLRTLRTDTNKKIDMLEDARSRTEVLNKLSDLEISWNQSLERCRQVKVMIEKGDYDVNKEEIVDWVNKLEDFCKKSKAKTKDTFEVLVTKNVFRDPIVFESKIPTIYRMEQNMTHDIRSVEEKLSSVQSKLRATPFHVKYLRENTYH